MLFTDYTGFVQAGFDFGIDSSLKVSEFKGKCAVDGWVALEVNYTSPRFSRREFIEIQFSDRPKNKNLCYLITTDGEDFGYTSASSIYVSAFLTDIDNNLDEISAGTYRYKKDYVVVYKTLYELYINKYKDSCHIWGGFYHENSSAQSLSKYKKLKAFPELNLPTSFHNSEVFRANSDSSALGRFLALYHLIELSFDYDLVEEIKQLPHDLKRIGKILASHEHSELAKLQRLVSKYWKDEKELSEALGNAFANANFSSRFQELLFDYEKDGFPWRFKDDQAKFQLFLTAAATSFTRAHFAKDKLGWSLENLQKSIVFTIYRFRCAIAHASIGECVLSTADDEFVHEVGEPLLMALLSNVFKR